MIHLDEYEIFRQNKTTLKETSKDDEHHEYMVESEFPVYNFDMVKRQYANGLGLSEEVAASVDAVVQNQETISFIEFKNGKVNNQNINGKIRDSLLIFCDITESNISYTRENVDFYVVYNEEKNPDPNHSRNTIAAYFMGKGNEEYIRFGLEKYRHMYFREVHTYKKEEFVRRLKAISENI